MVLNVSEEQYDYGKFEQQVLEFKFPGHPAPPLGMRVFSARLLLLFRSFVRSFVSRPSS